MQKQRIVLLGGGGLLATRLVYFLDDHQNVECIPFTRTQLDITRPDALKRMLDEQQPHWVVNGTAFLGPDKCEQEPETSYAMNYLAVRDLARLMASYKDVRLLHFSTDYVFDGRDGGYSESSPARPLSYYGLHKLLADEAILSSGIKAYIFRVASIVGAGPGKQDIIKALLARVASGATSLQVVQDMQISTVTTRFLAETFLAFIKAKPECGLYHVVGQGQTTWLDIIRTAFDVLGVSVPLEPISASAFPRPAPRPMKSWLRTDKLEKVLGAVPSWEDLIRAQVDVQKEDYLDHVKKKNQLNRI